MELDIFNVEFYLKIYIELDFEDIEFYTELDFGKLEFQNKCILLNSFKIRTFCYIVFNLGINTHFPLIISSKHIQIHFQTQKNVEKCQNQKI